MHDTALAEPTAALAFPDVGKDALTVTSDVLAPMANFRVTKTGLVITGDASFDEWSALVGRLYAVRSAGLWALGDALNFGESKYGERYSQALDASALSYQTCANVCSVARRVESYRRRENLSFAHHAEIAALSPDIADALLTDAERHGWSARDLREHVREARGTAKTPTALDIFAAALYRAEKALDQCDERTQLAAADHLKALLRLVTPSSQPSVPAVPNTSPGGVHADFDIV